MAKEIGAQIKAALEKKLARKIDLSKMTQREMQVIGDATINEIKKSVSKGISPIEGSQRFPAYKNPENYPDKVIGDYPQKRRRPVNLFLSGDFLDNLIIKIETKVSKTRLFQTRKIRVGFFDRLSKKKEQGHREGANGQPKRPIIPDQNEDFKRKIKTAVLNEYKRTFVKNIAKRR